MFTAEHWSSLTVTEPFTAVLSSWSHSQLKCLFGVKTLSSLRLDVINTLAFPFGDGQTDVDEGGCDFTGWSFTEGTNRCSALQVTEQDLGWSKRRTKLPNTSRPCYSSLPRSLTCAAIKRIFIQDRGADFNAVQSSRGSDQVINVKANTAALSNNIRNDPGILLIFIPPHCTRSWIWRVTFQLLNESFKGWLSVMEFSALNCKFLHVVSSDSSDPVSSMAFFLYIFLRYTDTVFITTDTLRLMV